MKAFGFDGTVNRKNLRDHLAHVDSEPLLRVVTNADISDGGAVAESAGK